MKLFVYIYKNHLMYFGKKKMKFGGEFVRICIKTNCLESGSFKIFDEVGNKKRYKKIFPNAN